MGDIKKQKKKFYPPTHPWQKSRIDEEKTLFKEYGLKNKREIWKMNSILKKFYEQAKKLTTIQTKQSEIERAQLLAKLYSLALLEKDSKLEDVLTITLKDIMNRRLQTLVFKRNLARSVKQARQFISHNHVYVGGKNITSPSYLVSRDEEASINFGTGSALSNPDHPERAVEEKKPAKKEEEKKKSPKKKQGRKRRAKSEKKKEEKKESKEEKKPKEKKEETKEEK
ncbi:30S ribosomal protein S4 [Candidatus Woesearchaeota archaeon]|nr:30S ribosomal protein S4 [Candidatus Woesearchaeota archaeon]